MRLLRQSDVEIQPSDRVFAFSRVRAFVLGCSWLGAIAWLGFRAVDAHWHPGYYVGGFLLLFFLLARRFITARFRPSNWLVRMTDSGLFLQFRSYLNYHLPADDLTVVFISFSEIRSARLIRERAQVADAEGRSSTQFLRYVELELAGDTAQLLQALEAERTEQAPTEKRWYGSSATLYEDHPATMERPPFLRIRWQASPRAKVFLNALQPYTMIADPVSIAPDFVHLQGLSHEEQQRRLRELTQRGEIISATYMARKLYGCSLAEANTMIENLKAQPAARG